MTDIRTQAVGVKVSAGSPVWGARPARKKRLLWALGAAVVLGTSGAAAAPEGAPLCSRGEQSALSELGCEIARGLGAAAQGAALAAAPLESDVALAAPERMLATLLNVVGGRLEASSVAPRATPLGAALARENRGTKLVFLTPQISRGELRVTADVYSPSRGFWERVKRMIAPPEAHVFASRRLDAELHTFLPPVPLVAENVLRSQSPEPRPVGVACGDLEGDGALELVVIGRQRIVTGRIRGGRLVTHGSADWSALAAVAASPLREPLARAALVPARHLDVGLSDRSDALRLNADLAPIARLGATLPWPGGGCAARSARAVDGAPGPCVAGDPVPRARRLVEAADAVAGARIVRKDGSTHVVRAARQLDSGGVVVSDDAGKTARVENAGAQLAVGDLDFDGQPEIVTTSNTLDPKSDAVITYTWRDDGALAERWRVPVPAGVAALAVCPAEDAGRAAVVVGVPGGVWLIR